MGTGDFERMSNVSAWVDVSDTDGKKTVLLSAITGFFEYNQTNKTRFVIQLNYIWAVDVGKEDYDRIKAMVVK